MLTLRQATDVAHTLFERLGETALAGVVLRAQEAAAAGDVTRRTDWQLIASVLNGMTPSAASA